MSKWVKGPGLKPLSVYHPNGKQLPDECELAEDHADSLRGTIELSSRDLRRILGRCHGYVLFSGGRDSLCTLLYLREVADGSPTHLTAVHVDTTAGFPEVTKYVRAICRKLTVPLKVVRPNLDYFEAAKKWGIPSHNARWCCHQLKVRPVRDFLAKQPGDRVVYDGIRAAESLQRSAYLPVWHHPAFNCLSVSPILSWSNAQVDTYVRASGLPPHPAAALGCSAECWCGAYKTKTDFEKLLEVHPEIFDRLVEVEKAQRGRFTFIYEKGQQVPLASLKRGRTRRAPHRAR
jgi:3'-phosphoadenosine 5'-phosphosulfate sulfotransferase (PAPS reductase)/FAD synthetase